MINVAIKVFKVQSNAQSLSNTDKTKQCLNAICFKEDFIDFTYSAYRVLLHM